MTRGTTIKQCGGTYHTEVSCSSLTLPQDMTLSYSRGKDFLYFPLETSILVPNDNNGPLHERPKNQPLFCNYWESTEAKRLLLSAQDLDEQEEAVLDALDKRIELSDDAINSTVGGYKMLLTGKGDPYRQPVFRVRKTTTDFNGNGVTTCVSACTQEWLGDGTTWDECCEATTEKLAFTVAFDVSSYSVQKRNRQYRSIEAFLHSNKFVGRDRYIKPEPKLFALFSQKPKLSLAYIFFS